jgi:hypothetical protein
LLPFATRSKYLLYRFISRVVVMIPRLETDVATGGLVRGGGWVDEWCGQSRVGVGLRI